MLFERTVRLSWVKKSHADQLDYRRMVQKRVGSGTTLTVELTFSREAYFNPDDLFKYDSEEEGTFSLLLSSSLPERGWHWSGLVPAS